uniref:Asator (inferred by orthology to a D. melanogaster protein) n=1 Tax=Strongyloides venezuelensis TaxID=75913 RepID=A0A0K0FAG5_STRVS
MTDAQPIEPLNVKTGDIIRDLYVVNKKVGEGACGTVYLVSHVKDSNIKGAMKCEPFMKSKDDEILKLELFVLKQMQKSRHACALMCSGKTSNYSFIIMSLLGMELGDLRRMLPEKKMSLNTTLRVGIQCCQAIQDMHSIGFIHRDIKPANFAVGATNKDTIFIFDFGLARQIIFFENNAREKLRQPRKKVTFRGTVRYCSVNVHQYKEQGRHDDLCGLLFMLIEFLTTTLPWKGLTKRESGHLKEIVPEKRLLHGCPKSFYELYSLFKKYTYFDKPDYELIKTNFTRDLKEIKGNLTDPWDWDKLQKKDLKSKTSKAKDELAEVEDKEEQDKVGDIEESAESKESQSEDVQAAFCDKEDTLDNVQEIKTLDLKVPDKPISNNNNNNNRKSKVERKNSSGIKRV